MFNKEENTNKNNTLEENKRISKEEFNKKLDAIFGKHKGGKDDGCEKKRE